MLLFDSIFFLEDSTPEPTYASNDNIDVDEMPPACDRSTQMKKIADFVKDPLKEDVANETDVWKVKQFVLEKDIRYDCCIFRPTHVKLHLDWSKFKIYVSLETMILHCE